MRPLVFILCLLTGTPTLFAQSSPLDTLTCGDTLFAEYNPQLGGSLEDTLLAWVGNCQSTIRFDFFTANVPDAADIYYVDRYGNEQFAGSLPYFGGNCYVNNYFFDSTQYPLSTAMNEQNCLPGFVEMYGQGYPFQDSIRRRMSLPSDFKFNSSFHTSARMHLRMPEGMWGVKFIVRSHSTNYSFLKILWDCQPEACITATAEAACVGDSLQLTALEEAYSYQWQGPGGFVSTERNPILPQVQLQHSGWYVLSGNFLGGLTGIDSIWVDVTAPAASIFPDTAYVCQGSSVSLTAVGGVSAYWNQTGVSGLQANGLQAQASPTQPTEYQVEVTDAQGCKASASAWVIPTAMNLTVVGTEPSCQGLADGAIQVQNPGGQAPYSLRIDGGDWQSGLSYAGLAAGSYQVEISDAQGCTGQQSLVLEEPEELILMAGTQSPTCEGACNGEVLLIPMGGTAPYQYRWEGLRVDSLVSGICAGEFDAQLTDKQGCEVFQQVEIEKGAAFRIKLKGDTRVRERELVTLRVESPQTLAGISWPGHCEADCLPELSFLPDSNQWVWVEARSEEGCVARDSAFIRLKKRVHCIEGIYAPNAFSPNGDGVNEGFTLYADLEETDLQQVQQFTIFNRWGKKVFQTQGLIPNDPTQGWDGTFQGKAVPPGAYTWAADFEREDGLVFTCGGNLLLLR